MKRILFILPSLSIGGLERVQVTLANQLADHGYDVTVMTLEPGEELRSQLHEKVHFVFKPHLSHPIMKRIPYIRYRFYDDGLWETRASAKRLHEYYIGDEQYDVEIAFFRGLPVKIVSGGTFRKGVKSKRIAWVHSDYRYTSGYQSNFRSKSKAIEAYRSFQQIVCVSNAAKMGFVEAVGDTGNLVTIYNLLSVNDIVDKASNSEDIMAENGVLKLVVVSRLLDATKGLIRLIRAVASLRNEGYRLSLWIIGDGPDQQMLREEIEKHHAESYIFLTGAQKNPYPYIKNADLLVCSSYYEGYNLTVAEALILETPVLSTNCSGPNEILDHGKYGMIVDNSEEGLLKGLKALLDDPALLDDYRVQAVKRRVFFDEEKLLQQIIQIIEQ